MDRHYNTRSADSNRPPLEDAESAGSGAQPTPSTSAPYAQGFFPYARGSGPLRPDTYTAEERPASQYLPPAPPAPERRTTLTSISQLLNPEPASQHMPTLQPQLDQSQLPPSTMGQSQNESHGSSESLSSNSTSNPSFRRARPRRHNTRGGVNLRGPAVTSILSRLTAMEQRVSSAEGCPEDLAAFLQSGLGNVRQLLTEPDPMTPACSECHASKTRCDRVRPVCGRCTRLTKSCSFSVDTTSDN